MRDSLMSIMLFLGTFTFGSLLIFGFGFFISWLSGENDKETRAWLGWLASSCAGGILLYLLLMGV